VLVEKKRTRERGVQGQKTSSCLQSIQRGSIRGISQFDQGDYRKNKRHEMQDKGEVSETCAAGGLTKGIAGKGGRIKPIFYHKNPNGRRVGKNLAGAVAVRGFPPGNASGEGSTTKKTCKKDRGGETNKISGPMTSSPRIHRQIKEKKQSNGSQ